MKRVFIIYGIFCFLFPFATHGQKLSSLYEYEMDMLLAGASPEYYFALKKVLSDYEEDLIRNGAIPDASYGSYTELLNEIVKDQDYKPNVSFDLTGALEKIEGGLLSVLISQEGITIAVRYLKKETSKSFDFNSKVSQLIDDNIALDRSKMAALLLEVYDEDDLKLPMVKLKILKFLDPDTDLIVYSYIGPPTRD